MRKYLIKSFIKIRKERVYLKQTKSKSKLQLNKINSKVWWINPSSLTIGVIIPIYVMIGISFNNKYLIDKSLNYFRHLFIVGLIILIAFYIGNLIGMNIKNKKNNLPFKFYLNSFYLDILFLLTIFAYLLWFHKILIQPSIILKLLSGDGSIMYYIRNTAKQIEGITTFTQLGTVYSIFYTLILTKKIDSNYKKRHKLYFFIILFFTLFRVLAWSERLALLEVVIPIIVIIISEFKSKSFCVKFAPYIGIVMLFLYFGVFEYFRSWSGHYKYIYDSYVEFITNRVSSYYITALNNGAGIFSIYGVSRGLTYFMGSLYKIPFLGYALTQVLYPENNTYRYLSNYGNLEFNNISGIYLIIIQLGIPLGILFTMLFGMFIGVIFNQFKYCNGIGLFIYPFLFIGIVEFLRIFYFTETRTFYIYIFILIGYIFFVKKNYNKI